MGSPPPAYARPCRARLHTIPAGVMGCPECTAAREERRRAARQAAKRPPQRRGPKRAVLTEQLRALHLPLGGILAGAVCGPEVAQLFDVDACLADHRDAMEICSGCPVRADCYADAYAGRQLGVYGGVVMNAAFWAHEGRRRKGLVQSVQDVQDSSAC